MALDPQLRLRPLILRQCLSAVLIQIGGRHLVSHDPGYTALVHELTLPNSRSSNTRIKWDVWSSTSDETRRRYLRG